ncbi:12868_t:CDS:2 [Entrophospora sp. SA101]|nr:3224_t:CDS:2 [Entrophospora sp. SA101]CAJ0753869.1 12868_t:CDS:2 [Entrophospora sp. SA101]CAJ0826365.1 14175_t:CDS:2 [Entrophospora sp. SA101]
MVDLTSEFRKLIIDLSKTTTSTSGRNKKNHENATASILLPIPAKKKVMRDEYLKEAYRIVSHINNLKHFLLSVRKAYLNISTKPSKTSGSRKNSSISSSNNNNEDNLLINKFDLSVTSLTNIERDEIDLQAKIIIQQFLAAIHSSIAWYLNKRLTEVSKIQKDQQEARMIKEMERRESTLYKSAAKLSLLNNNPESLQSKINEERGDSPSRTDSEIDGSLTENDEKGDDDDDIDHHLSAEQKMVLEMENESIMKELETSLQQVNQAEKALLEISNLQTILSNHLTVQTQQTDRLYAEAIATTDRVQEGNLMLIKARERASDTRKWILVFLILASFILFFLDWYD